MPKAREKENNLYRQVSGRTGRPEVPDCHIPGRVICNGSCHRVFCMLRADGHSGDAFVVKHARRKGIRTGVADTLFSSRRRAGGGWFRGSGGAVEAVGAE
jgi:hypothetical protein